MLVVWSLRWMLAAHGGSSVFRTKLRSSSDDRMMLLQLERMIGSFGLTVSSRRWGALSAARPAKQSLRGDCWEFGEAMWMIGGVFW